MLAGLRHPAGDRTTRQPPPESVDRACVSEPPTWNSGMPKSRLAPGLRLEQQIHDPCLIDLIGVGVADELRRSGSAAGVEVGCSLFAANLPAADKPRPGCCSDQLAKRINAVRGIAGPVHLHNGFEVLEPPRTCSTFCQMSVPGIGPRATSTRRARGIQDFRDLMRLQQRIDGIGDAGGLGAEQRDECLGKQRQQETHDIALADAEGMKHVGGLRHARDKIAMGDDDGFIRRISIGQELDGGRIGIVGRPSLIAS